MNVNKIFFAIIYIVLIFRGGVSCMPAALLFAYAERFSHNVAHIIFLTCQLF